MSVEAVGRLVYATYIQHGDHAHRGLNVNRLDRVAIEPSFVGTAAILILPHLASSNLARHKVIHRSIDHIPAECLQPARSIALSNDSENCLTVIVDDQGPGRVDYIADQDIGGHHRGRIDPCRITEFVWTYTLPRLAHAGHRAC